MKICSKMLRIPNCPIQHGQWLGIWGIVGRDKKNPTSFRWNHGMAGCHLRKKWDIDKGAHSLFIFIPKIAFQTSCSSSCIFEIPSDSPPSIIISCIARYRIIKLEQSLKRALHILPIIRCISLEMMNYKYSIFFHTVIHFFLAAVQHNLDVQIGSVSFSLVGAVS